MRSDKAKNIAKVARVVLADPLLSRDEVAMKAGVSQWTASNVLAELDESWRKDPRIVWLTDKDFELMESIQSVKFKRLKTPENINDNDLDKWENTAVKRYTIFRGKATDEQWGLNNIESIDIL